MDEPVWAADSRFDTTLGRWEHRHELDESLLQWTATQDDQELMHHLQKTGVTAGAVLTSKDLVSDPHLEERAYFEVFDNENAPQVGPRKYAGRPFRIPRIPVSLSRVAALGQHNMKVLREIAGMPDSEIEQLVKLGILNTAPKPTEQKPQGGIRWGG